MNELLKRRKRLHELEVKCYTMQIINALKYLHSHRIIHRDLKLGNLFLNDKCKDAINFSDFIDRIEISHDDLENNRELGFVNGVTKILMDNLNTMNLYERPIHCTDTKRETLYIKDADEWKKEDGGVKLESAIQEVSRKSIRSLIDWKNENPDYDDLDSDFSKKCIEIQQQSCGSVNKTKTYPKIIQNIARNNTIKNNELN